ncbi:hypothetical protein E8E13_000110 [Curvularia kusanoi]|uniref:Uncharacterized protein n=1 Tax=Curvularia kusanoi TaxID=90978 RepID=A0A9P4W5J5_CURKU|nr:hypothetical protein E8E13_000110 [Curvularia kusanoi]
MPQHQEHYKFHLTIPLSKDQGQNGSTAEDFFYHWGVVHTVLMLATDSPIRSFARYSQNYANPDVPNKARLVQKHPSIRYWGISDHWGKEWGDLEMALLHPSHAQRMGRHHFGDMSGIRAFLGKGGPVFRSPDFAHPADLTICHWLVPKSGLSRRDALLDLDAHKTLMASTLKTSGARVKYTLDICDDAFSEKVQEGVFKSFPGKEFFAVEWLHFGLKEEGFAFIEKHKDSLRHSYSGFIDTEQSHSVYAVERVVLDFTNDSEGTPNTTSAEFLHNTDPSTKTPLPAYYTDENSLEYKMQHRDWALPSKSFEMMKDTKWASYETRVDREERTPSKALDPEGDWLKRE